MEIIDWQAKKTLGIGKKISQSKFIIFVWYQEFKVEDRKSSTLKLNTVKQYLIEKNKQIEYSHYLSAEKELCLAIQIRKWRKENPHKKKESINRQ